MNLLEIIGALAIGIIAIVLLRELYRKIIGYSWNSCPNGLNMASSRFKH